MLHFKRALSSLLILALLLAVLPINALAEIGSDGSMPTAAVEDEQVYDASSFDFSRLVSRPDVMPLAGDPGFTVSAEIPEGTPQNMRIECGGGFPLMANTLFNTTNSFTCFGDQLNTFWFTDSNGTEYYVGGALKSMYDEFAAQLSKGANDKFFISESLTNYYTISNTSGLSDSDRRDLMANCGYLAIYSVLSDFPAMFYASTGLSWSYYSGGNVQFAIRPIYAVGLTAYSDRVTARNALISKRTTVCSAARSACGTNEYALIKYLSDWLSSNATYNDAAAAVSGENAYGSGHPWLCTSALLGGVYGSPVCAGYSRAMLYLCEGVGISCLIISGSNHMWNNVKVNGVWSGLDVTNYDANYGYAAARDMYFLRGDLNNSSGHYNTGDVFPPSPFLYPVCQTISATFKKGDANWDGQVNLADAVLICRMAAGLISSQSPADVDGNGVVNVYDVLRICQYFAGKIAVL